MHLPDHLDHPPRPRVAGRRQGLALRPVRPYYGRHRTLTSDLPYGEARSRVERLVTAQEVAGRMEGDVFWLRPGRGAGAYHAYLEGEVVARPSGSSVELREGTHPLGFTLEMTVLALVLFWAVSVALAYGLQAMAGLRVNISWQPVLAVALLIAAGGAILYLHRQAAVDRGWMVSSLERELGRSGQPENQAAPSKVRTIE